MADAEPAPEPDAAPAAPDAAPSGASMTYALAPDDFESEAGIVIGGNVGVVLAKYRFVAAGGDLALTRVRLSVPSASVAGVLDLRLYDGTTLVGSAVPNADGNADFTLAGFTVPADAAKTIAVKADLAEVGLAGAPSGLDLTVTLKDGAGSGESGTYEVRDAAGSIVDTVGDSGDVAGRTKVLRKTKPTVSLIPLPSTALFNGVQAVQRFAVTADAAENVSLSKVSFETDLFDGGGVPIAIASPAIRTVGAFADIPATASVAFVAGATVRVEIVFDDEQVIAAGTSVTYDLRVMVTGADGSGEALFTMLLGDDGSTDRFEWSDNSAAPHSELSDDWADGRLVKVLPSDWQALVRF